MRRGGRVAGRDETMTGRIPYYVLRKGYGYWQPTKTMRLAGFSSVPCGKDGPEAQSKAEECNRQWKEHLSSDREPPDAQGYVYFMKARDTVKIGFSRNPFTRIGDVRTGMSAKVDRVVVVRGSKGLERCIHERFSAYRRSGEWFTFATPIEKAMIRAAAMGTLVGVISSTKLELV